MSGRWIGDPRSEPCEMGGGPLVDYGYRPPAAYRVHYVLKSDLNTKLERIAALVESGPFTRNAAKALAVQIRGMKEEALR
jgi:hypothetical protein